MAYRQGTVMAAVGTKVKERDILTANQKFRKACVKLQKASKCHVKQRNGLIEAEKKTFI